MAVPPDPLAKPTVLRGSVRLWLLVPYAFLLFPVVYARNTPTLWGIPFFYWYQLLWVLLASGIIGFVFHRTGRSRTDA